MFGLKGKTAKQQNSKPVHRKVTTKGLTTSGTNWEGYPTQLGKEIEEKTTYLEVRGREREN